MKSLTNLLKMIWGYIIQNMHLEQDANLSWVEEK